ncbi:hypothetical protein ANN_17895 [Periplaneta americana]|uniref:Uncharacterized protein n=1 Tax=Periplaneta americana TaxID=6978 RepID=A0ABQ8SPC0_PERAM|nr:hypothetical protein ANN_17895 [Periplaneta americana]
MKKVRSSASPSLHYVSQYGEKYATSESVNQHVNREKHKRGLQRIQDAKQEVQQILLGQARPSGFAELCEALISANIPLTKVNNLKFRCVKSFLKAPSRVAHFKSVAPEVPLLPSPILTMWGTWLEAPNYYSKHITMVKNFIDMLDSSDAASIKLAQELL